MNLSHIPDLPEGILRRLNELPKEWTVRRSYTFTQLIDGFNVLLFGWVGLDRAKVLHTVTQKIANVSKDLAIEGIIVDKTEDYAAIILLIRHRSADPGENYKSLQKLASHLNEQFPEDPLEGPRAPWTEHARMMVWAPDRPMLLNQVTGVISNQDPPLNIVKLKADIRTRKSTPMSRLRFKLEVPSSEDKLLANIRDKIETEVKGAEVRFPASIEKRLLTSFPRITSGRLAEMAQVNDEL